MMSESSNLDSFFCTEEEFNAQANKDGLARTAELMDNDERTDLLSSCKKKSRGRGRPSKVSKYPEIVAIVKNFIEQNSSAAHLRRRDEIMYSNGVTLQDIVKHVKDEIPGIQISATTIHQMMLPPRRKTINSKRYRSFVHARVPAKRNSGMRKTHPDFHWTQSQVSLVNQIAQLCEENTVALSVDNKNKVEVGNVAVSRRCTVRKFYLEGDEPNHYDHDYPYKNAKLVPAGYQERVLRRERGRSLSPLHRAHSLSKKVKRRCWSAPPCEKVKLFENVEVSTDRIGRPKVVWPRFGPLTVQLYPSRSIESTSVMHMNFLLRFLTSHMKNRLGLLHNVIAIADGGPDWSTKGVINLLTYGYLWQNLGVDYLVIQCFAPGCSRFNPIERSWAYLTQCLVSVVLEVAIESNDYEVPTDSDTEGWNKVLDNAVDDCGRYWDGKLLDGFPMHVSPFYSSDERIPGLKNMHAQLKNFKDASATELRSKTNNVIQELKKQYAFLVRHCVRKAYQIEFIRCENLQCVHCSRLPKRKNLLLDVIRSFGMSMPAPTKSIRPQHYKSLEEMLRLNAEQKRVPALDLDNCTTYGHCPYPTCNYAFFSQADKDRHFRLMGHDNSYKPPNSKAKSKRKTTKKTVKKK